MNDLLDEMEADMEAASEFNNITTDGLKTVSSLAQEVSNCCLLYTSPSPRDRQKSRMPSSA